MMVSFRSQRVYNGKATCPKSAHKIDALVSTPKYVSMHCCSATSYSTGKDYDPSVRTFKGAIVRAQLRVRCDEEGGDCDRGNSGSPVFLRKLVVASSVFMPDRDLAVM